MDVKAMLQKNKRYYIQLPNTRDSLYLSLVSRALTTIYSSESLFRYSGPTGFAQIQAVTETLRAG